MNPDNPYAACIAAFRAQGFCVVENFLTPAEVRDLVRVGDHLLDEEAPLDGGGKFHDIGRGDARRFNRQGAAGHGAVLLQRAVRRQGRQQ